MLLLSLEVLLIRMNDRGRRQVVVLGGRRCRAMVEEGVIVDQVIFMTGGICLSTFEALK